MAVSWARLARWFTPRFRLRTLFAIVGLVAVGLWAKVELPGWQRWWQIREARGRISQYERIVAGDGDPAKAPQELVAILGDSRLRHWGAAYGVATGPGEQLMSFGSDNRFRAWDVANGEQAHVMATKCFVASVDGCRAFLVNEANEVLVWDAAAGEVSSTLHSPIAKPFRRLAASFDGSLVAALGGDFTDAEVTVWNVQTGEVTAHWPAPAKSPQNRVVGIALSRDGKLLATINDSDADIWDVATRTKVQFLPQVPNERDERGRLYSVIFSHDGRDAFTSNALGVVHRWNLAGESASGEPVELADFQNTVHDLVLDRSGQSIYARMDDRVAELAWDERAATGWHLRMSHYSFAPLRLAACSVERELQLFGSHDHPLTVWRNGTPIQLARKLDIDIACLAFTADGKYLITGGSNGELALWHVGTWTLHASWQGHTDFVRHLAASSTGQAFVSGSRDDGFVVWDIDTQQQVAAIPSPFGYAWPTFTADGRGIVVGRNPFVGNVQKGVITIYEVPDDGHITDRQITSIVSSPPDVHIRGQIVPTPDGKLFVAGASRTTLSVWDGAAKQTTVRALGPYSVDDVRVAVSPDSTWAVASLQGYGIAGWDLASGEDRWKLPKAHAALVQSVAVSPDGRLIASAAQDGFVRLWASSDSSLVREFPLCPPSGTVRQVAFSPDGTYLATANGNGTAYVLDIQAIRPAR